MKLDLMWQTLMSGSGYFNIKYYYDYANFTNKEGISNWSFGNVIHTNHKDFNTIIALKYPFNLTINEIVNELKCKHEVDYHANIIQFYRILKMEDKYLFVMKYSDCGSLQFY
ncbi:hypothetical protein RhiirA4_457567 [Rhizophagus irregularis]|uniref:Protein kinase domain-containing protein n=1 Tax=Rhizophagus irregularis TaxID=588596 RepID=A0A2I1GAG7_9GLOM|nr:hypothetical protein RhiirA4_457567 [Rhizophagus irregularis]